MPEEINFDDLTPIEVPVKIAGKKYILREANGDAACRWRNALLKATKLGPDGKPASMENVADTEPLLVSLCLFELTDKGEKPAPLHVVRSWPQKVQARLFQEAKRISELEEKEDAKTLQDKMSELREKLDKLQANGAEDPAKNALSSTMAGSDSPAT